MLALLVPACGGGGGGGGGGDTTAPLLSSTIPVAGAADVDNNTADTLTLAFSESVVIGAGNIYIRETAGDALFDTIPAASLTGGGTAAIIATLNKTLLGASGYYVQIDAGLFADAAGNPYAGIADNLTWRFTTLADTTGPVLASTNPAHNAVDVPSSLPRLRLTFNEDVSVDSGTITIFDSIGTTIATIGTGNITVSGKTAAATFPETLSGGTQYNVQIAGTLFRDAASNYYSGIADTTSWVFTAVTDATPPALVSLSPADGTMDVDLGTANLSMTFNENIYINAGNVVIYEEGGTPFRTIAAGFTTDGATVTIPVGVLFDENTNYYVQVDAGLFTDKVGNAYAGIADDTTWNFRAVADTIAPTLTSRTPAADATGVGTTLTALTMAFSEDVAVDAAAAQNIEIRDAADDSLVDSIAPAACTVSPTDTVTATLGVTLLEGRTYYVMVPADFITDTAYTPNYFGGVSGTAAWRFTMWADTTAPAVTSLSPADDTNAVSTGTTSLVITFDDNVTIGTGDVTIYNEDTTVFEAVPAANLTGGGTNTITVPFTGALTTATPSYYVTIPATLFSDSAYTPNFYAGIADAATWNFSVRAAVPAITGLDSSDDTYGTGTVGTNADGITYNTTGLSIDGTSDPNVDITLYVDGVSAGTTTASGLGAWSVNIDRTEGVYSLTATATANGYESAASGAYSLTVDTTDPALRTDVASADRVVVLATASLTSVTIYTAEAGTAASYTGVANPYTVTVVDVAGNDVSRNQVYTTATGLKTAVEGIAAGTATVYVAEAGTYALGGGPAGYIDFTANATVTVKGVSTGVIITYNTNNNDRAVFNVNSAGTLYLDTLAIAFTRTGQTNVNCAGNISVTPLGSLYLKNILMHSTNAAGTELVDYTTSGGLWTWNGTGYTQVTVSGGGWTVTGSRYQFPGSIGTTYWQ